MKIGILFAILFISSSGYSHGEDKAGPNGGNIKMPGAFHTEVVQVTPLTFKVFLLDINWSNPSIKESNLKVSYKGKSALGVACEPKSDHFLCELPKGGDLNSKAELIVNANREGAKGVEVVYKLPLKFKGETKVQSTKQESPATEMDHSQHH